MLYILQCFAQLMIGTYFLLLIINYLKSKKNGGN